MSEAQRRFIAMLADLPPESNKAFKVDGRSILLCRTASGVYAVDNQCTHAMSPLEGGRMRGHQLYCPKHGACFDLRNGKGVAPLGKLSLRCTPVQVGDDGLIEIELASE